MSPLEYLGVHTCRNKVLTQWTPSWLSLPQLGLLNHCVNLPGNRCKDASQVTMGSGDLSLAEQSN